MQKYRNACHMYFLRYIGVCVCVCVLVYVPYPCKWESKIARIVLGQWVFKNLFVKIGMNNIIYLIQICISKILIYFFNQCLNKFRSKARSWLYYLFIYDIIYISIWYLTSVILFVSVHICVCPGEYTSKNKSMSAIKSLFWM